MGRDIVSIIGKMRASPASIPFSDLLAVCEAYFGKPRKGKGSHQHIFKMPWTGDPRLNLQPSKGNAKTYQVRQVLAAVDKKDQQAKGGK